MTRLFIRFYLGVILVLFVAWLIQVYVFRGTTEAENIAVIEGALGGGALSARDDLIEGGEANLARTLETIQMRFAYPVNLVSRAERPMNETMTERLDQGEVVLHRGKIAVALTDTDLLVELGPLPQFAGPNRGDVLLGLGSVLLLAAAAIAILLRPITRQFRSVERTALAIADGDFSARIDEGKRKRVLPLVVAFNTMAGRVESLIRSQKELLQAVSHELRTPLARIKFATELVRSAKDNESRSGRADAIDDATDQLDSLVGELLDYTRYDQGGEPAEPKRFVLNDLIVEVLGIYRPLHPNIHFQFTPTPEPTELNAYRAGLQRAIGNLVSNAGKYAGSQVALSVRCDAHSCEISVDDDGSGISEEDRDSVFEPFKRLQSGSQPGTGLGLALVRRICRRLGGEVIAESSELGGARFIVRLPLQNVA